MIKYVLTLLSINLAVVRVTMTVHTNLTDYKLRNIINIYCSI